MWYLDLIPKQELIPNKYALTFLEDDLLMSESDKKRALNYLIALKQGIVEKIPKKEVDRNILLATWNIKEFGHLKERLTESYYYIAEIINAFDIVAIQEIKSSLFDLQKIMKLLGSDWKYIITDITEGTQGNKERFGYIYDTRRVKHSGLSGELVVASENFDTNNILNQLKRTPAITGFESGWKKFAIINVHLHPGNGSEDKKKRKQEVKFLMDLIRKKKEKNHFWNKNLILMGDTNLFRNNTDIVKLITNEGFKESEGLLDKPTTASETQIYDRIFLHVDRYFKLIKDKNGKEKGDVFKLYDYAFTDESRSEYHKEMKAHKNDPSDLVSEEAFDTYFHRFWKRNQLSDHLPVWIEIESDSSSDFLKSKLQNIVL